MKTANEYTGGSQEKENHTITVQTLKQKFPLSLLFIFLLLAAGIAIAGALYYHGEKQQLRHEVEERLSTVADLKVRQITEWRQERVGDATLLMRNRFLAEGIQRILENDNAAAATQALRSLMRSFIEYHLYQQIFLLDTNGRQIVSVPDNRKEIGRHALKLAFEALNKKRLILSSLHTGQGGKDIHIDLLAPVLTGGDTGSHALGVLLLRIDPEKFLFPLIQSWPTPSKSAETLLVCREGNEVVFLNELRHQKDTALTLRYPLETSAIPAAMAIRGQTGIVEGKDYRNVPVLAALRAIPDTPWFLVAKIDKKEVFALMGKRFAFVTTIVSVLILASGLGVLLFWRHQSAELYRRQYETEHERQVYAQRYEHLTRYANDIILLTERDGKIIDVNERAVAAYGYDHETIRQMNLRDLRSPETKLLLNGELKEVEEQNGMVFETMHQNRGGTVFPVEVSSRIIEIDGKIYYQSIVRDISERKEAEKRLYHANRLYAVLSEVNQTIIRTPARDQLFQNICRIAIEFGEFKFAWIAIKQEGEEALTIAAFDGIAKDFSEKMRMFVHDMVAGRGKLGEAVRHGRSYLCNDIQNDPEMRQWSAEAENQGCRSYAAFPFRISEKASGFLFLCSAEVSFFNTGEIKLLEEVAGDIAYALKNMEMEEKRRHVEKELVQHKEQLEELVRDRTSQLENANKQLKEINEELGAFSYSVSHDLRAPLRHIAGFVDLLNRTAADTLDEKGKHYLKVISDSSKHMAKLIDDLLSFSRTGRSEVKKTPVDLNQLLEEVLNNMNDETAARDITWEFARLPEVEGDRPMLKLVFTNLISNAVKFTKPTPQARIEIGCESNEEEFVCFIRDNGAGFDMTYADRLFCVFQRLHRPEEFEGTGIGLANVKRIIQKHGGKTWAEGKVDEGATFYFTLPKTSHQEV